MALNQVNLTAAMNNNLLSLQRTQKLMDMTQLRLSTGLKVNSALDNPSAYYAAKSLTQRAGDLDALLDSMGQAIQTLKATDEGIMAATKFVEQAKAIAEQAAEKMAADPTGAEVSDLAEQFDRVMSKLDDLIKNSSYKGINLLSDAANSLTVYFAEGDRSSAAKLVIQGVDATTGATGLNIANTGADGSLATVTLRNGSWATGAGIEASINETIKAIDTLRGYATSFSTDYNIVANREEFTENLVNVLTEGASKLTLADMNEEAANMLALQTRQQLGVNALSLASQAAQSVLRLF